MSYNHAIWWRKLQGGGKAHDRDHAPGRMKPGEAALLMVGGAGPRALWEPDPPVSQ